VPYSDIFHVRLWVGSSTSQTVEGVLRVRAPGKILCSAPAWGRDPWAQRQNARLARFAAMFWYGDGLQGYLATYLHSPVRLHGLDIN